MVTRHVTCRQSLRRRGAKETRERVMRSQCFLVAGETILASKFQFELELPRKREPVVRTRTTVILNS